MYKDNTFLAIIPARGGSKGLPGKNIKELCGKPLIAWSIEAGLKSQYLDEVVVSTDYQDIANISKKSASIAALFNFPVFKPSNLSIIDLSLSGL